MTGSAHDRVAVKVCGVCRPSDAAAAVHAGAAYVGVILAAGFRRSRTPAEAREILAAGTAAGTVGFAGVWVDPEVDEVCDVASSLGLHIVQLHGDEPRSVVEQVRAAGPWQVWKAVRVRDAGDVMRALDAYDGAADALLLDGWSDQGHGGVGASFDWDVVARARAAVPAHMKVIVAGGLRPHNVAQAIRILDPDVVDVSSGVEAVTGIKSVELISEFMAAARGAGDGRNAG